MGHTSPDIKRPEKPLRSLLRMVRTLAERRKALQRGKLSRATAAPATTPTSPTSPTPPFLPRAHVSSSLTSASRRAHSTSEVLLRNACVSAQEAAVSQISASNARSSVLASYLESAVGMKRRRASDVTSNSSLSRDIHAACAARQSPPEGGQGRRLASSGSSESLESSLTRSNGRHSSRSRTRKMSGREGMEGMEENDRLSETWGVLDLDPTPSSPPPPKRQRRTRSLGPLMSPDTAREIKEKRERSRGGRGGGAAEMETEETGNRSLLAALARARASTELEPRGLRVASAGPSTAAGSRSLADIAAKIRNGKSGNASRRAKTITMAPIPEVDAAEQRSMETLLAQISSLKLSSGRSPTVSPPLPQCYEENDTIGIPAAFDGLTRPRRKSPPAEVTLPSFLPTPTRTRTRTRTLTLMTLISTSSTRFSTTERSLTTDLTFRLLLLQHNDVLFAITPYTL